jgi:hypothetical protein
MRVGHRHQSGEEEEMFSARSGISRFKKEEMSLVVHERKREREKEKKEVNDHHKLGLAQQSTVLRLAVIRLRWAYVKRNVKMTPPS